MKKTQNLKRYSLRRKYRLCCFEFKTFEFPLPAEALAQAGVYLASAYG